MEILGMNITTVIMLWFLVAFIFGNIASYKGYNWLVWGLTALFLPFVGILAVVALPDKTASKKQLEVLEDIMYSVRKKA